MQEGDKPPEDPGPLLAELDEIADELERLIGRRSKSHQRHHSRSPSGVTLTEALARRDVLGLRHSALKAVADATAEQRARYSRSEIRMVRTFDVGEGAKRRGGLASSGAARSSTSEIQAGELDGGLGPTIRRSTSR